jgi:plastocyanin
MSLVHDGLRAFAAGTVAACALYSAIAAATVPAEVRASIDNFVFKPDPITVRAGTKVVWENDDDIPHTVVALDGAFRSPALDTEDKFSFIFAQAGTFEYFCSLHPRMKGQVVVTP